MKTYVKTLTDKSLKAYKKQKSYVNRLYKKERQMFFDRQKKKDKNLFNCPTGKCMFKVNKRNTRARCEICSDVFIVNFEHISHLVPLFLLLTLCRQIFTRWGFRKFWKTVKSLF